MTEQRQRTIEMAEAQTVTNQIYAAAAAQQYMTSGGEGNYPTLTPQSITQQPLIPPEADRRSKELQADQKKDDFGLPEIKRTYTNASSFAYVETGTKSIWDSMWWKFCWKILLGTVILASPAIVLIIMDPFTQPNLDINKSFEQLTALKQFELEAQIVRWSIFLSVVYADGVAWWYFLGKNLLKLQMLFLQSVYSPNLNKACSQSLEFTVHAMKNSE